ncbi:Disulfide bond formation protein D precursor [Enhygromyxa salina]|uniref:Disulfide bond formation protein D n=1 Tax=Enhygromyxa salina TaxID=215803 RepID=A0A2S9YI55_9BACT|nr:thioredoxin domain-containing protein [Enhygromyxa salina]PRQ04741.1 Disulfide bond formation protein D precursor [Enhygromyxa salina]
MKRNAFFVLLPLVATLSLLGCDAPPGAAPAAKDAEAGAAEAGAATATATPEGDAESCTNLANKICEEAGAETQACTSVKTALTLLSPKACAVGLTDIEYTKQQLAAQGQVCAELSERLCKDLGPETKTCAMVKAQTPNMPSEKCVAMTAGYDKTLAELQRMEAKNKPLPADKVAKLTEGDVPSFGPEDAKVTVVEFSDFQCPYCSRAANAVNEIKSKYGDRVRFVFRQFPLSFHQQAHLAAQASLAAQAQGKFWEFHDKLFANQKALERADLEKYAKEVGLDMAAFNKALDDGTYKATVDAELELGKEVFVDGTPTMFINGTRAGNATDVASISAELDKALGS